MSSRSAAEREEAVHVRHGRLDPQSARYLDSLRKVTASSRLRTIADEGGEGAVRRHEQDLGSPRW